MGTVIWEPAEGIAVARCQAARVRDPKRRETTDHPSACGWCIYPDAELGSMVDGFNAWAGWNERMHRYDRFEVAAFRELKPDHQRDLVAAAQELTGEPWPPRTKPEEEPMSAVDPVSADAGPPERPSWL